MKDLELINLKSEEDNNNKYNGCLKKNNKSFILKFCNKNNDSSDLEENNILWFEKLIKPFLLL